ERRAGEDRGRRLLGGRRGLEECHRRAAAGERRRLDPRGHGYGEQRGTDTKRVGGARLRPGRPQAHLYHPPARRPHGGPERAIGMGAGRGGRGDRARGGGDLRPAWPRPLEQRAFSPHFQQRRARGRAGRQGAAGRGRGLRLQDHSHAGPHARARLAAQGRGRPPVHRRRLRAPSHRRRAGRWDQGVLHGPAAREALCGEAAGRTVRDRRHVPRIRAAGGRQDKTAAGGRALPVL
ncbi:MAG: Hydroxyacylglutathione hydrolase, partial [uncultured Rubrobacteraceae bacterium]